MNVENQTVEQQENIGMTDGDDRNELQPSCMRAFEVDHSSDRDEEISVRYRPSGIEWDGKGFPPVGWKGLSSYTEEGIADWCDFHEGVVMGVNGDYVWMAHHGKFQRVHHIGHIEFKNLETPEQKKERERLEYIHDMVDDFNVQAIDLSFRGKVAKVCAALYDAGYRK